MLLEERKRSRTSETSQKQNSEELRDWINEETTDQRVLTNREIADQGMAERDSRTKASEGTVRLALEEQFHQECNH